MGEPIFSQPGQPKTLVVPIVPEATVVPMSKSLCVTPLLPTGARAMLISYKAEEKVNIAMAHFRSNPFSRGYEDAEPARKLEGLTDVIKFR